MRISMFGIQIQSIIQIQNIINIMLFVLSGLNIGGLLLIRILWNLILLKLLVLLCHKIIRLFFYYFFLILSCFFVFNKHSTTHCQIVIFLKVKFLVISLLIDAFHLIRVIRVKFLITLVTINTFLLFYFLSNFF